MLRIIFFSDEGIKYFVGVSIMCLMYTIPV